MAAPARNTAWWQDPDTYLGAESNNSQALYARPSVTTGATLPWGGKASSNLGPPRAFYAGPQSIPTITVTSSQPGMTNLVCKPELPAILHSPFAEIATGSEMAAHEPNPKPVLPQTMESDVAAVEVATQGLEECPPIGYPTQGSLQSAATSFALEGTQPPASGHVITTAQDEQGLAITIGRNSKVGEINRKPAHLYQGASHVPPHGLLVVTTNASLQANEAAVRNASEHHMASPAGLRGESPEPYDESVARRAGLRSAASPESTGRPYQAIEDLQQHDSFGLDTRSTDLDLEEDAPDYETQRRIRRRNNNRESAKRVREKRDADLKAVNEKVVKLQDVQSKLLEHCSQMDNACRELNAKLQSTRSRLENSNAENSRLKTEVEHLRRNVRVGDQRMLEITKIEGQDFDLQAQHLGLPTPMPVPEYDDQTGVLVWDQAYNSNIDQFGQDWRSW